MLNNKSIYIDSRIRGNDEGNLDSSIRGSDEKDPSTHLRSLRMTIIAQALAQDDYNRKRM